jgi:hypothetical protein
MQEHQITLAEIKREAMLLEFDVDISTGCLDIFKRSDSSSTFYSIQEADDPRVLIAAWQFLQFYRTQLDQLDAARRELANHPPRRRSRKTFVYRLAVFALAVGAGAIVTKIANNWFPALLVFVVIFAMGGLLRPRRFC